MKHKPLVSILINNYNKQDYCEKAIRSALYQSYKKIEIIFYDDFSNDLSLKRIQNLKIKFKNKLKIIKNKKRTEIFSFNQINGIIESLKKSKGKIICLMDSDDFFKKDKVAELQKLYNEKLEEAMNAQRNGDMDLFAQLSAKAQEYLDQLEEEEKKQKKSG